MPRLLAGFFIAEEGNIRLHLTQDKADGRWLEFRSNVSVPVDGAEYSAFFTDDISLISNQLP